MFCLCFLQGISQEKSGVQAALEDFLINEVELAHEKLKVPQPTEEQEALLWHIEAFLHGVQDTLVSDLTAQHNSASFSTVLEHLKLAEILNFHYIQKDSLIFEHLSQAVTKAKQLNDSALVRLSYKKLLEHNFDNNQVPDLLINLCDDFKPYLKTATDSTIYGYYKYFSIARTTGASTLKDLKELVNQIKTSDDELSKGILNQAIGIMLMVFDEDYQTALNYFKKASNHYERVPGFTGFRYLHKINNNLGIAYSRSGNPRLGLTYYRKASRYDLGKNNLRSLSNLYLAMSEAHEDLKNYDSALYYSKKEKAVLNEFKEYESALMLREIDTKYKTAEKEKQILIEQQKKEQNRNIAVALGGLLFFGGLTFVLIQKNTKRKQLIAEQEKEIQMQKVDGLMKKMELNAIDALIEGQEKERQRIASDLHNDLGNLITTLQLNFESLEEDPSKQQLTSTKKSLVELYTKVRRISHVSNAGILSSGGLLKSLNNLVSTVNETKKIHLHIHAHDMDNSLVNSLELTIFRIVQELITNMLKHSNAKEGYIHLTNHGDHLNIMIEDDGIGFNVSDLNKANGMGINSIQKHVENLGGTMNIDTAPDQGSVFLINIPI